MFKIVLLVICLLTISSYAYIDPALDAERRAFLPSFLMKITENSFLALNNLSVHATPNYCWNNQYSGSFCDDAAKDYVIILFQPVPFYNATTGETVYLPLNLIGINILSVNLVTDGLTNDTYSIKYILNNTQLNGDTFTYDYQDGLYYTTYYVFQKGSNRVSSETVTSDDGAKFIGATSSVADLQQLCMLVVNYACAPGTQFEQYNTYEKCIQTMQIIDQQNANRRGGCPDPQVSNTTICRLLHAATALTDAPASQALHCPHAGTPSTHCIDLCWDVCDQCDINAKCQYQVNQYGTRSYKCVCNDGYIGNGTSCSPTNCTAQYQCAGTSNYNFVGCDTTTNKCKCQPTFFWNATNGGCDCPSGYSVWYINGAATCLQNGRCRDRYQCSTAGQNSAGQTQAAIGNWNQVQCVPYGPITTLFPDNTCLCNYGYTGGFFIPCSCPAGRSEVYSPTVNGNVCITSSQCVANYNCPSGKQCNFSAGPSYGVGVCV